MLAPFQDLVLAVRVHDTRKFFNFFIPPLGDHLGIGTSPCTTWVATDLYTAKPVRTSGQTPA